MHPRVAHRHDYVAAWPDQRERHPIHGGDHFHGQAVGAAHRERNVEVRHAGCDVAGKDLRLIDGDRYALGERGAGRQCGTKEETQADLDGRQETSN